MLEKLASAYAVVAKVDVSNLAASQKWYQNKLGLQHDPRFDAPTWRQLNFPGIARVAVGLNLNAGGIGTGGAVTTLVVADIVASRNELIGRKVDVSKIQDVGQGVQLAFFKDPDGNSLGLRQNGTIPPDQVGSAS
jgi:lactoylglutathione lyase